MNRRAWLLLTILAAVWGASYMIFYTLTADVGPSRAALVTYIAPGYAVLYGVWLLDEPLTAGGILGLILILWVARGSPRRAAFPAAAGRQPKRTLPLERARAWARSTKSRRLIAALNSRVTSRSRAFSERRSSSPCLASRPKSTVAAIS
ncbi:hypothetical protein BH20ACT17_BH20ACT17_18810 [soil metagenome]